MRCKLLLWFCVIVFAAAAAWAQEEGKGARGENTQGGKKTASEAKELSGMSIVGNDEAPKSLYIVPWKSSEIGVETSLRTLLDARDGPVDRDVFMRQLEFYNISTAK